jgi:hypothetical protein
VYEQQSTFVLGADEEVGGGGGWQLVDLNVPLPAPHPDWLRTQLLERRVACEFPECDAQAVGMLVVANHLGFVCKFHIMICTTGSKTLMREARLELSRAMLQRILDTTYGTTNRLTSMVEQLMQPFPSTPKVQPRPAIDMLPVRRPQFGQM